MSYLEENLDTIYNRLLKEIKSRNPIDVEKFIADYINNELAEYLQYSPPEEVLLALDNKDTRDYIHLMQTLILKETRNEYKNQIH